jgi:SAM-dependent methyltransferase
LKILPPEPFVGSYLDVTAHKVMLQDVVRTSAYDDALRRVVRPGSRVIDFGSGTGVLSIFAARHGAGQVDAIERTAFIEKARVIARASGHPEIRFHQADHESFSTDGPADVLVSEWMGHFLFFEAMMDPLLAVRDRWLAPHGVMVPGRVSCHAGLLVEENFYEDLAFLTGNPYGIDFSSVADRPLRQSHLIRTQPHELLDTIFELGSWDMKTIERAPQVLSAKTHVERAATVFGIVAWFSTDLAEDVWFGTGPHDPETHWQQMFFPFPEPFEVSPERAVSLEIRVPTSDDPTIANPWAWSISDGAASVSVEATT